MHFSLLDRIIHFEPGKRLTATKVLSMGEEYLQDHFPLFPVMPGVLMLQAMYEAGAWLVRASEDFQHAGVLLSEARNVKYADFVEPGNQLEVTAEILKQEERLVSLKTSGRVQGRTAVSARLVLERFHLAERAGAYDITDQMVKAALRERFQILYRTQAHESLAADAAVS